MFRRRPVDNFNIPDSVVLPLISYLDFEVLFRSSLISPFLFVYPRFIRVIQWGSRLVVSLYAEVNCHITIRSDPRFVRPCCLSFNMNSVKVTHFVTLLNYRLSSPCHL